MGRTMDRRSLLRAAASLPLFRVAASAQVERAPDRPPSLIVRQRNPENLEFPFESLDSFLTPNDLFYVRSHFNIPIIDRSRWRLSVAGDVEKPLDLSFEELAGLPSTTAPAVLECSGNG